MSKFFEAVERVNRERLASLTDTVRPLRLAPALSLGAETEMLKLYRALEQAFPTLDQKQILFMGAKGGEGTSTVVSGLARFAAETLSRNVTIVDVDALHSGQCDAFGISPQVGWDDVLAGKAPLDKAIYAAAPKGISVVPVSSAGAGLVDSVGVQGLRVILRGLRERGDLVFVDCAPATIYPDAFAFGREVDGVVLVIAAESTRKPVAAAVIDNIKKAGGRILGIVFNKRRYYIPDIVYRWL